MRTAAAGRLCSSTTSGSALRSRSARFSGASSRTERPGSRAARSKGFPSRSGATTRRRKPTLWLGRLVDGQDDLADVLRALHQAVRVRRLLEGEGLVDLGLDLARLDERPD